MVPFHGMRVYPGNTNPRSKMNKYTKIHRGKNTPAFGLLDQAPTNDNFYCRGGNLLRPLFTSSPDAAPRHEGLSWKDRES